MGREDHGVLNGNWGRSRGAVFITLDVLFYWAQTRNTPPEILNASVKERIDGQMEELRSP
jgi:hypothetical protein